VKVRRYLMMLKSIPFVLCLSLVGCGKIAAEAPPPSDAGVDTAVTTPTVEHTIDFAAFENSLDLEIYSARSLALTLEPSKTVVKLAPLDVTARPARALRPSEASDCIPERPFVAIPPEEGELAAGESASLVSMDVAFFGRVDDSGPKLTGPYFLCFGTRSADGSWQTWFRKTEIVYDAPSNELRAHYVFDEGVKADAIRFLVTGSMRPATPKRIVYRTRVTP
jgi:hypothetical protein